MSTNIGFNKEKKRAAIFVAHPDDETIWMGGTILTYKDWEWNILESYLWTGFNDFMTYEFRVGPEIFTKI